MKFSESIVQHFVSSVCHWKGNRMKGVGVLGRLQHFVSSVCVSLEGKEDERGGSIGKASAFCIKCVSLEGK